MVDLGRMDLLEVPAHCRQQVASMLGREDELNPPEQEPEEPPIEEGPPTEEDPGEDESELNDPGEGESPPEQD